MRRALALITAALLSAGTPVVAEAAAPRITQMVVFRDGSAQTMQVRAAKALVRVRGRRCAAGSGTALAALARSRVGRLRLRDFGSCSRRPRDGAGLFVSGIGADRNRGRKGWAYKVGRRGATAGAADPAGAFGNGRLRCRAAGHLVLLPAVARGCQRSLELRVRAEAGALVAGVRGYNDEGKGVAVEGATVRAGGAVALTGADGRRPPGARRRLLPRARDQGRARALLHRAGRGAVSRALAAARLLVGRIAPSAAVASARARSSRAARRCGSPGTSGARCLGAARAPPFARTRP